MRHHAAVLAAALLAGLAVVPAASARPISDISSGFGILVTGESPVLTVAVDPSVIQVRVSGVCASGFAIQAVGADGGVSCVPFGWSLTGNSGTTPGTNFIGTTDNQAFELKVNGTRALRLEPARIASEPLPNVIGGNSRNSVVVDIAGAAIAGGAGNRVGGHFGTIGGGTSNFAFGQASSIAGGEDNSASGSAATVAGGSTNRASGTYSTVAGGGGNIATEFATFAAGFQARALHEGAFVWADSDQLVEFASTAANEFSARATGGVRFVTAIEASGNPTAGVRVAAGSGSWSSLSDRTLKRNFVPTDGSWILQRLAGLPISTWSYKAQKPSIRHLGPTAQDFSRAFGLGEDNRHIDTIDSEGVALAGIKALYTLVQVQERQLRAQQREIRALQRALHVRRTP